MAAAVPPSTGRKKKKEAREAALMQLGMQFSTLSRAYRAAADRAVAHVGLSQTLAWPVVMVGRLEPGVRQGVLAEALGIEGPSLVRSIDQLVEAGYVERREDPADRRAKTLYLTPAGEAACEPIEAALSLMRAALFDGVADDDLAACLRVFGALEQRLGRGPSALASASASASASALASGTASASASAPSIAPPAAPAKSPSASDRAGTAAQGRR